jgi:acetyl-CoA C-acetyltransferase
LAIEAALKQAKVDVGEIQIAELYDQSTVVEMISLEDLGFAKRGRAWFDIYNSCNEYRGYYEIGGKKLFVNLNGGLKADGNPMGAAGGAQIFEVVKQLSGEAGGRQAKINGNSPKVGCVSELEGFGTKAYVHLLGVN